MPAASLAARLRRALLRLDGVEEHPSQFADRPAFWVNGKEIAHLHGEGEGECELDLRLTRAVISAHRARLKTDPRVTLRRSGGDWVEVRLATAKDLAFAAELAALAVDAHRPPAGRAPEPPPSGPALARRRKLH